VRDLRCGRRMGSVSCTRSSPSAVRTTATALAHISNRTSDSLVAITSWRNARNLALGTSCAFETGGRAVCASPAWVTSSENHSQVIICAAKMARLETGYEAQCDGGQLGRQVHGAGLAWSWDGGESGAVDAIGPRAIAWYATAAMMDGVACRNDGERGGEVKGELFGRRCGCQERVAASLSSFDASCSVQTGDVEAKEGPRTQGLHLGGESEI
jgi:hypothetical protein